MKNIIYVIREYINLYPPCISQILMLNDLGIDVQVHAGDISENLKNIFIKRSIKFQIIGNKRVKSKYIGKVQSYYNYKMYVQKLLKLTSSSDCFFWFGTADSAFALYPEVKKLKFALNILELYDKNKFYNYCIKKVANYANAVVVNEINRAYIMKNWYNLRELPFVMPNKTYEHPRERNIELEIGQSRDILCSLNAKIILYQGIFAEDRNLMKFAKALRELDENYVLLLMGNDKNGTALELRSVYERVYHIDYIPAPDHLKITSHAYIGIAKYDDSSLNNIYCAPNKTYEYSGFGIPVIGNNVPGLINSIDASEAGVCCDFESVSSIIKAIQGIDSNYELYSKNAMIFFDGTDNYLTMKMIISRLL